MTRKVKRFFKNQQGSKKHSHARIVLRAWRSERGSVTVMTAVLLVGLVLVLGMAIDVARIYMVRSGLQDAADAAALAAARELNYGTTGLNNAVAQADAIVNTYGFNHTGATASQVTITEVDFAQFLSGPWYNGAAAVPDASKIQFVRVWTQAASVNILFAVKALGNTHIEQAKAVAGVSPPLNTICDFMPAFVLDTPANPISPGNVYTFRLPGGGAMSPGDYGLLALNPGGSIVRTDMAGGAHACAQPGSSLPTKTGVTAGDVRQGLNTRFDIYGGGLSPDTYPPDTNVAPGITYAQYSNGTVVQAPTHPGVPGRRILIIPITLNPPGNGSSSIVVNRFGIFFMQQQVPPTGSGGDLQAEYIGPYVIGRGGFDPNGPGTTLALPVLYK
jgi:Flp pilus assembly protein TadG